MICSPTKAAAEALAKLLPDLSRPGRTQRNIFHLPVEDPVIARQTVEQAFQNRKKKDMSSYWKINEIILPYHEMIEMGTVSNGKKTTFTLKRFFEQLGAQNTMVFVLRSYLDDHVSVKDRDFHELIQEYNCSERVKPTDGFTGLLHHQQLVFIVFGKHCPLPDFLRSFLAVVDYPPLTTEDYRGILEEHYQSVYRDIPGNVPPLQCSDKTLRWYANHMGSLPESEVRRIIGETRDSLVHYVGKAGNGIDQKDRASFFMDEAVMKEIERLVRNYKNRVLNQNGYLKVVDPKVDNLEGLENLNDWFDEHVPAMQRTKDAPSGIVLAGPPGTGKSTAAKLAAIKFGTSLVQLEMDRILGGLVGDSEKNMRAMLEDLKFAAPCVLWIDELEKILSGAESGNKSQDGTGVMKRLMGMLLSFMQENESTVFIAATANDISGFPEEFFRNGRFDQAFSVMLPDYKGCCKIMRAKLDKYLAPEHRRNNNGKTEYYYSLEDAGAVLNCFIGTKDRPLFLTGSDIDTYVREITWRWEGKHPPKKDDIIALINKTAHGKRLPEKVRAQVPSDARTSMEQLARRYLDMISYNFTLVGGVTPFVRKNMDLDRICFFKDDEGRSEMPMCFMYEGKKDAWQILKQRCESDDPSIWYDASFFRDLNAAMTEVVIRDDRLTLPETRQEYWKYQIRTRSN